MGTLIIQNASFMEISSPNGKIAMGGNRITAPQSPAMYDSIPLLMISAGAPKGGMYADKRMMVAILIHLGNE